MPAPSAFHFFRLGQAVDPSAYPDVSAYFDDLVAVYRAELAELAQAGCRYVQLDEVPVAMLCDPDVCRQAAAQGGDPTALLDTYLGLLQRIVADRPAGMTFGMHLCRGNFRGRWMAAGGYEPVAEKLFNATPGRRLLPRVRQRAGRRLPAAAVRAQGQARRSSASSRPRPPNWKIRTACCAASRRPRASSPSTSSACPPNAALPAWPAAMC